MIFNEPAYYLLFLGPSVLVFHASPRRLQPLGLAAFGCLFFLYFAYLHFGGWRGSACVGLFLWELLCSRLYRRGSAWCTFGVIQAVLILVAFKYTDFFYEAWGDVLGAVPRGTHALSLGVIPLGLSFFSFEFIHFAAEIRRGTFARPPFRLYAAFIFFFPTMVAGPIKRFHEFERQMAHARFTQRRALQGVTRILVGLVKKHLLADTFALWSDQLNTDAIHSAEPWVLVGWVLAYGWRIYFDFSGYSDIALGSANLYGMRFSENFNWPYLTRNIAEFWRHWHISLGRWILDYVYIPLGGSRLGAARNYLNLIVAFTVSGLWHGAAYNFVLWGAWHGVLNAGLRAWDASPTLSRLVLPRWAAIAGNYALVNAGWALFCMDLPHLRVFLSRMVYG